MKDLIITYLPHILTALGTASFGLVFTFVKQYFDGIKEDNKRTREYTDKKISELEAKIDKLSEKYGLVFNELLVKFSQWEDRIKKVMEDYILKIDNLERPDASNVISLKYESTLKDFQESVKSEMKKIFTELNDVENDIKQLGLDIKLYSSKEKKNEEVILSIRNILGQLSTNLNSLRTSVEKTDKISESKINKVFIICKKINSEHQELLKKMENLEAISRNKISFRP